MSRSQPLLSALAVVTLVLLSASALHGSKIGDAEKAGAILFRDKGCAYCHGVTAAGTDKGPSLANIRKTWKPAQIADQIENGGQKMPAFKDAVTSDEVTRLVAWLRARHRPAPAPVSNSGQ